MNKEIRSDDIIFNFFKQICDEKDDTKCIDLGNNWILSMKKNINNMENNLPSEDKAKYKRDIQNNRQHLDSLKNKTATEWRNYATKCMVEILDNKK